MSPEQVRGEKLDARSDLFSLGLVLYEMATGRRAFTGETEALVHDAIVHQPQVPVRDLNSTLPPELERITNKALEKVRERRYQSAMEMHADLKEVRSEGPALDRQFWTAGIAVALAVILVVAGLPHWRSPGPFGLCSRCAAARPDGYRPRSQRGLVDDAAWSAATQPDPGSTPPPASANG